MTKLFHQKKSLNDTLSEMSKGKGKILVDYNLIGTGRLLREKGYTVYFDTGEVSDPELHKRCTDEKIHVLITKNKKDFVEFRARNYVCISLKHIDRPDDIQADLLVCLLRKGYASWKIRKPTERLVTVTNALVKDYGCKM